MNCSLTVILRGTERYHMEDYLKERGYHQVNQDSFQAPGIQVNFESPRKVPLGSFWITEVEAVFEGDAAVAESEASLFRRHFLTAGG